MSDKDDLELQDSNSQMVESWIFSLIPVSMAFVFYVVFILQSELANKNEFLAIGAAAAFIGLETYWLVHGWRLRRKRIVLLGATGIVITLALVVALL